MIQETQPIQVPPQIIEQQTVPAQQVLTPDGTPSREIVKTTPSDSNELDKGGKGWNLPPVAKLSYVALVNVKALAGEIIRGDPESKRLVTAALQERLEAGYLKGLEATDRQRVYTLRQQVLHANQLLSEQFGEGVNLPALYRAYSQKDPESYPPLNTAEGLSSYFSRFYPEILGLVLSASEIASEGAEIEAQKTLEVYRGQLEVVKIEQKGERDRSRLEEEAKTAQKLIDSGDTLKEAEQIKGEILASRLRGYQKATFGQVPDFAETIADVWLKISDKVKSWFAFSPEIAIPAGLGGTLVPIGTFAWLVTSSEAQAFFAIPSALGYAGGAAVVLGSAVPGALSAIAVTYLGIGIKDKTAEIWNKTWKSVGNFFKETEKWLDQRGLLPKKVQSQSQTPPTPNEGTNTQG